ncbi:hypothetical protein IFM89_027811, partial [Coptis chinensis]
MGRRMEILVLQVQNVYYEMHENGKFIMAIAVPIAYGSALMAETMTLKGSKPWCKCFGKLHSSTCSNYGLGTQYRANGSNTGELETIAAKICLCVE